MKCTNCLEKETWIGAGHMHLCRDCLEELERQDIADKVQSDVERNAELQELEAQGWSQ